MFGSLKTARDLWKFRLRMALALQDPAPAEAASPDELDRLVAVQTAHWQHHPPLGGAAAEDVLRALNASSVSAFVLSVRGRSVRLWDKPAVLALKDGDHILLQGRRAFEKRALLYRAFLEKVLRRSRLDLSFDLALDVNDIPAQADGLPVFGFQKKEGAHNLLLPDVDFFHSKWYRREADALGYDDKTVSACFVGSSTGDWLDEQAIRDGAVPRLRAAAHFHGHAKVVFRISNAVHCLSPQATALLQSQPYFSSYMAWEEQLRHRFLLSMDGNGAACSRLVKGLFSNSVVVKFASAYGLYYFPALMAGRDYLLAGSEDDVEGFIDQETAHPGTFEAVAASGRRFAEKYLHIGSVMDYTARLLVACAGLLRR